MKILDSMMLINYKKKCRIKENIKLYKIVTLNILQKYKTAAFS